MTRGQGNECGIRAVVGQLSLELLALVWKSIASFLSASLGNFFTTLKLDYFGIECVITEACTKSPAHAKI